VLAAQLNTTECVVLLIPVPDIVTLPGEFAALLLIVIVPVWKPVVLGEKLTKRYALWPADNVTPPSPPIVLNAVPLTLSCEISTLEFPVFFTVNCKVFEPPSSSLPKLKLELDSDSDLVAVDPVPLKLTVNVGLLLPLLVNVILPVKLVALLGVNVTVTFTVADAASPNGMLNAFIVNPLPLIVALDIVNGVLPVFFNCTVCVLFVPTAIVPKLVLLGVAVSIPVAFAGFPQTSAASIVTANRNLRTTCPREGFRGWMLIFKASEETLQKRFWSP